MTTKGRGRPITKASTVLGLVYDSLEGGRWCQGTLRKRNGAKCLVGHFEHVIATHKTHITQDAYAGAASVVHAILRDRNLGQTLGIPTFNDDMSTRKRDVLELVATARKAAKRAERLGVSL
jgi:hypothetical protein